MSLPYEDLLKQVDVLAVAMRKRLELRGSDPWSVLERGHSYLPSRLQHELDYMFEARMMASHPKLALQINMPRIEGAVRKIDLQLRKIDLPRRRRQRNYGIATTIALNLAFVVGAAIAVARWRGLI